MAWIKLKSALTGKIISVQKNAYNDTYKSSKIFEIIEEVENKKQISKSPKPKEELKDVENIQLSESNEDKTSGKNKKKTGI